MLKRAFDVVASLLALIVTAPISAVVGLAIRLESRGPILHRARRVGRDGTLFTLLKFRTMVVGAASQGPGVTAKGDPRVTRVGRILRATKLDELPQLIN